MTAMLNVPSPCALPEIQSWLRNWLPLIDRTAT